MLVGNKTCTYSETCGVNCTRHVQSTFPCYSINASTTIHGVNHHKPLYRSPSDVPSQCFSYECAQPMDIKFHLGLLTNKLEDKPSLLCYYEQGDLSRFYTGSESCAYRILLKLGFLVLMTLLVGLFYIALTIYSMIRAFRLGKVSFTKFNRRGHVRGRSMTLTVTPKAFHSKTPSLTTAFEK